MIDLKLEITLHRDEQRDRVHKNLVISTVRGDDESVSVKFDGFSAIVNKNELKKQINVLL